LLGSKNGTFGFTYDYELLSKDSEYILSDAKRMSTSSSEKIYPTIHDDDAISKIFNAMPNDYLICTRILFENSPYSERYVRFVESNITVVYPILPSGICVGSNSTLVKLNLNIEENQEVSVKQEPEKTEEPKTKTKSKPKKSPGIVVVNSGTSIRKRVKKQ